MTRKSLPGRGAAARWRSPVQAVVATVMVALLSACEPGGLGVPAPGPTAAPTESPSAALVLGVSPDGGRYLVDATGRPFFWMADTAWALTAKLDRTEVAEYLDTRAAQGFTVIQTVAIFPHADGLGPNAQGDRPYSRGLDDLQVTAGADPENPAQYDYWDHLDHVVEEAAARGLRVALWPIWADQLVGSVLTEGNAGRYGRFLGERYGDRVVWVLGGDETTAGDEEIWRTLAAGIIDGAGGTPLMTYHPLGDDSSARYFHDDPWLGLNMVQGGHCLRYDLRASLLAEARAEEPAKPFLDGEPIYEGHPYCWKPADGYSTALDVRRDAYRSLLAGAAGVSYGHHTVWQFAGDGEPVSDARGDWRTALDAEGAGEMRYVAELAAARPWWQLVPDPTLLTGAQRRGAARVSAAAAPGTALIHSPDGQPFEADLDRVGQGPARLSWFDPRTGRAQPAGTATSGPARYEPPTRADWVLVADDPARGLPAL